MIKKLLSSVKIDKNLEIEWAWEWSVLFQKLFSIFNTYYNHFFFLMSYVTLVKCNIENININIIFLGLKYLLSFSYK